MEILPQKLQILPFMSRISIQGKIEWHKYKKKKNRIIGHFK